MITLIRPILLSFLGSKAVKNLIIELLEALVARTDNTLDDMIVSRVRLALEGWSNSFRSSMFDLQIDDGSARILRDALRLYRQQWSGGHPQEQIDIEFLEMQFTRMCLEASLDAWLYEYGTGLILIS